MQENLLGCHIWLVASQSIKTYSVVLYIVIGPCHTQRNASKGEEGCHDLQGCRENSEAPGEQRKTRPPENEASRKFSGSRY